MSAFPVTDVPSKSKAAGFFWRLWMALTAPRPVADDSFWDDGAAYAEARPDLS